MAAISKVTGKKGTRYRVQVRKPGFPVLSKTFPLRKDAKKWGEQQEALMVTGEFKGQKESDKHTLQDLIDRYTEDTNPDDLKPHPEQKRLNQLKWWGNELGYRKLSNISKGDITEYRSILKKTQKHNGGKNNVLVEGNMSPSTVNRYSAALSSLFKYGVTELFWLTDNPAQIPRLKEPKEVVRWLKDDEKERLLKACSESEWQGLLPLVLLALNTGARRSSLLQLRWSQIDLKESRAYLPKTKNGDAKTLPLIGGALIEMKKWNKVRNIKSDWVFPSPTIPSKYYSDFRTPWFTAVEKAQLDSHFRFHDLRHTTASYLAKAGVSQPQIMSIMGHKSLLAAKRYMHLNVDDDEAALQAVFGK